MHGHEFRCERVWGGQRGVSFGLVCMVSPSGSRRPPRRASPLYDAQVSCTPADQGVTHGELRLDVPLGGRSPCADHRRLADMPGTRSSMIRPLREGSVVVRVLEHSVSLSKPRILGMHRNSCLPYHIQAFQ